MKYRVKYNSLYEKWQLQQKVYFGWVCLEEFVTKEKASEYMKRLTNTK